MIEVPQYKDLLGVKYARTGRGKAFGLDCMGLVLKMYERAGKNPVDPLVDEDAVPAQWSKIEGPSWEPMDVLYMTDPASPESWHVALYLGDDEVLHSMSPKGVVLSDLDALTMRVHFGYRFKASFSVPSMTVSDPTVVTVRAWGGPFGPVQSQTVAPHPGAKVWDFIPKQIRDMDIVSVKLNGESLETEEFHTLQPRPGDVITLAPLAGIGLVAMAAINLVVGIVMKFGEYHWNQYSQISRQKHEERAAVGPSYAYDIMANTYEDGAPIPVVMGRVRTGGIILQQFTDSVEEGIDRLNTLVAVSHGVVESITACHMDGNSLSMYAGSSFAYTSGTNTQAALGDFRDTVTTVATNTQLLADSSVTVTGTANASKFKLKIYFPSGCYHIDGEGDYHSALWRCKIEYRPNAGGAWTTLDWNTSDTPIRYVNQDSLAGTNRLFINFVITSMGDARVGDKIIIDKGGFRRETHTITAAGANYRDLAANLNYDHFKSDADGVYKLGENWQFERRRTTPFSRWIEGDFPSSNTWDIRITRTCPNQGGQYWYDAYIKEYQQLSPDDLRYPLLAVAGVRSVANEQLSGSAPRLTFLVEGIKVNTVSSTTLAGAAAFSRVPAELMLGMLYNREWGLGNDIDAYVQCTMTATAGNYTVGETVTGPSNDYQFRGTVISWDGTSKELVVESDQGLPHGTITGGTSAKAAVVSSIDECYGCNFSGFNSFKTFTETYVPDGNTGTTVNQDSASGTDILFVASTSEFSVGDQVCINFEGTAPEVKEVLLVLAGPARLQLTTNLGYNHLALDAHEVNVAQKRALFDYVFDGSETGWDALERIAKCSRAVVFRGSGNYINVRPLQSETPAQLVTMGSVLSLDKGDDKTKSSFLGEYPEIGPRANRLTVWYRDEDQNYMKMPATIEDPVAVTNGEDIIEGSIELYGISRQQQALREAWFRLKKVRYGGDPIQYKTGQECMDYEAGDVFSFAHAIPGKGLQSGRIVSSTNSTFTLDQTVTIPAGTYYIKIRHSDDTTETKTISSAAGTWRTLTIVGAWGVNPTQTTPYAIYAGTLAQYRVMGVKYTQDLRADVVAEEDTATMYTEKYGVIPTYAPTSLPDPDAMPPDVENLTLSEGNIRNQARGIINIIDVHFTRPEHESYSHAEIWMRDLSEQRIVIGATDWATGTGNQESDHPRGVCTDGTYIYVVDCWNCRVIKCSKRDLAFSLKVGSYGLGNDNFDHPMDACTDGTYLYVLDTGNHRLNIRLCADLTHHGNFGAVGAGNGQFSFPHGICIDTAGNLYVADTFNHRIQKFTTAVGVPAYSTKIGTQGNGVDQVERPMGIDHPGAVGNLLIADTGNDRLAKLDDGLLGNAGAGTWATYGSTGVGDNNFDAPIDVALKSNWSYYWVCDFNNHRVHRRSGTDNSLDKMTGGTAWGTGRDQFKGPRGICHVTADDNICIAEYYNHRTQLRNDGTSSMEDWHPAGETSELSFRINRGVTPGEVYEIAVVSVSPNRVKKHPRSAPSAEISPTGVGGAPSNVANIYAANFGMGVRLWWDAVVCHDLAGYEVRAGNDWQTGRVLVEDHLTTDLTLAAPPITGSSVTYRVKARTTSNQYSAAEATVSHTAASALISANLPVTHSVNLARS